METGDKCLGRLSTSIAMNYMPGASIALSLHPYNLFETPFEARLFVRRELLIQEAEGGLVTAYAVQSKRAADTEAWEPALKSHVAIFGRAPCLATADRGVSSHRNEITAHNAGVHRVCLPGKGRASARKRTIQRQALVS